MWDRKTYWKPPPGPAYTASVTTFSLGSTLQSQKLDIDDSKRLWSGRGLGIERWRRTKIEAKKKFAFCKEALSKAKTAPHGHPVLADYTNSSVFTHTRTHTEMLRLAGAL